MLSCHESIDLLLAYLEGELPPEEAAHLESHLEGCPPCIDFVRSYEATPKICKRALARTMPTELAQQLDAFLEKKIPSK